MFSSDDRAVGSRSVC